MISKTERRKLTAGEVIPGTKYVVVKPLGRGGQGEVYLAQQGWMKKLVAVKLLNHELTSKAAQAEFREEAIKQAALEHVNITQVFDGGMTDEVPPRPFFAMEYGPGRTLQNLVEELRRRDDEALRQAKEREMMGLPRDYVSRWIPIRTSLAICADICKALTYAHREAGLIHRDLKGANIYIAQMSDMTTRLRLLDFGISRLVTEALCGPDKMFRGTYTHAAPEQYRGEAFEQTDLYSLTVILYELLTKRLPFWDAESAEDLVAWHQFNTPEVPSRYMNGLSPRLIAHVMKNLQKDPKKRSASALDYARELREIEADYVKAAERELPVKHDTDRMPVEELLATAGVEDEESIARATQGSHWDSDNREMVSVALAKTDESVMPPPAAPKPAPAPAPVVSAAAVAETVNPRIYFAQPVADDAHRGPSTDRMSPNSHEVAARQNTPPRQAATTPMLGAPGRVPARSPAPAPVQATVPVRSAPMQASRGSSPVLPPPAEKARSVPVPAKEQPVSARAPGRVSERLGAIVIVVSVAALCLVIAAFAWAKKARSSTVHPGLVEPKDPVSSPLPSPSPLAAEAPSVSAAAAVSQQPVASASTPSVSAPISSSAVTPKTTGPKAIAPKAPTKAPLRPAPKGESPAVGL
jgi:serine/threonine protein kinase